MALAMDLNGHVYGRLTVLARTRTPAWSNRPWWTCQCTCGNRVDVTSGALRGGNTRSCGCLLSETRRAALTTHGLSRLPEYRIWKKMKERCCNQHARDYRYYGGRGITVCERWLLSFVAFLEDMGRRPSLRHMLERLDNDGPYSPENCCWATRIEQANNRRNNRLLTWNGRTQTLAAWSRETGIPQHRIEQRLNRCDWSIADALTVQPLSRSDAAQWTHRDKSKLT